MKRKNDQYAYGAMAHAIVSCGCNAGFTEYEIADLLPKFNARLLHLRKNAVIARQGERAKIFGLVISGSLHLVVRSMNGETNVMRVVRPGEFAGHNFLVLNDPYVPCDAIAYPECKAIALDVDAIRAWGEMPVSKPFFRMIAGQLSRSLVSAWQHSFILGRRTLVERVMAYFIIRSVEDGTREIALPGTQGDLAAYLYCDRTALSRALADLVKQGKIARRRHGRIQLLDTSREDRTISEFVAEPRHTSPAVPPRNSST